MLRTYGSFPVPLLLAQGLGRDRCRRFRTKARTDGTTRFYTSEIQHAGGATLSVTSSAFLELQKWLANGAAEDGSVGAKAQQTGTGAAATRAS